MSNICSIILSTKATIGESMTNTNLTQEEYALLSCSKEGWYKEQERYTQFMDILKRYIELWGTAVSIDFIDFCFPEITFNGNLIDNRGMQMINCTFYGKVTFKDIVFEENVRIQECTYHNEVVYENLKFRKDISWIECIYEKQSRFKNLIFVGELYTSWNTFENDVLFEQFTLHYQSDLSSIVLKSKLKIVDLKGIEFFKWDELRCIYNSPQCEWEDKELYLDNYFKKNPDDLKTSHSTTN